MRSWKKRTQNPLTETDYNYSYMIVVCKTNPHWRGHNTFVFVKPVYSEIGFWRDQLVLHHKTVYIDNCRGSIRSLPWLPETGLCNSPWCGLSDLLVSLQSHSTASLHSAVAGRKCHFIAMIILIIQYFNNVTMPQLEHRHEMYCWLTCLHHHTDLCEDSNSGPPA